MMNCENYLCKLRTCKHDAFVWIIDKSYRSLDVGSVIRSEDFLVEEDYEWQLHLYPKSDEEEFKDYCSLYLVSKCKENARVRFICSVLNDNSQVLCNSGMHVVDVAPRMSVGVKRFSKSDRLTDSVDGEREVESNLRLLFEMWMIYGNDDEENTTSARNVKADGFDFGNLVNNTIFSDIKFFIEGKIIYAHRMILANRSAVFGVMFDYLSQASDQENVILITDVEYEIMVEMFRYIYCGHVDDLRSKAKKLIIAAFKYGVNDLIQICQKSLVETLSISNVFELLRLTNLLGGKQLKQKALAFIAFHCKDISQTADFNKLRNIHIDDAFEIISLMVKQL